MFSNFLVLVGVILLGKFFVCVLSGRYLSNIRNYHTTGLSSVLSSSNSTWVQSKTAPSGNWFGVASCSTGTHLIAASSVKGNMASGIYLSSDGAVTWTNVFVSGSGYNEQWNDVASSSDGYILYAIQQDMGLFASTNIGASWTRTIIDPTLSYANYNRVSCSSTGATVAVSLMGGYIYVSSDFGRSFTASQSLGTNSFYFVSVSSNGFYLTAGASWLYTSMNGGMTWSQNPAPNLAWTDVAYSSSKSNVFVFIVVTSSLDMGKFLYQW